MTIKEIEIKVYYCRDCDGEVVYHKTSNCIDIWKCDSCNNEYRDLHIVKHKHKWKEILVGYWCRRCGCIKIYDSWKNRYKYYYPKKR